MQLNTNISVDTGNQTQIDGQAIQYYQQIVNRHLQDKHTLQTADEPPQKRSTPHRVANKFMNKQRSLGQKKQVRGISERTNNKCENKSGQAKKK